MYLIKNSVKKDEYIYYFCAHYKNIMSKLTITACFLLLITAFQVLGQASTDELTEKKVTINGQNYYLYQVQPSEGLFRISQKFGVSQQDILKANPGIEAGLKVSQVIKIPVIPGRNSSDVELVKSNKYLYHKVEKGQTLFFISRQYGVSEQEIIALNPGSDKNLKIGFELRIPKKQGKEQTNESDKNFVLHEVMPRETLYSISRQFGAPIEAILALNPGLESGVLQIGTSLKIPNQAFASPAPKAATKTLPLEDDRYIYHNLLAGETLYSIGKKYNVDVKELMESNGINDVTDIKTGYLLLIPKGESVGAVSATSGELTANKPAPDYFIHETGKNESLRYLSEKYKVDAKKIMALNPDIKDRKWNKLKKRSAIKIPVTKKSTPKSDVKTVDDTKLNQHIADSMLLIKSFIAGCDTSGIKGAINVAFLGPFYLDINDSINWVEDGDSLGMPKYKARYPKEIYPQYNIFREFYFGSLLAIDSLKSLGISVNVYTYDVKRTPNDNGSLKKVLALPELQQMHVIFGPAHGNQVPAVADFCRTHGIKMVLPFGQTHQSVDDNPNLYCLNARESLLYPEVSKHIVEMYADDNIILVTGNTKDDRQELFSAAMRDAIFQKRMQNQSAQAYYEVNFEQDGIAGIERLTDKNKRSIVIIASKDKKLFNAILPSLYYLKSKKNYPVSLFGFPEWMRATVSDLKYMFELNTVVFNQYYVDYSDAQVTQVLAKYTQWFGSEPTIAHPTEGILHPNNGLLGYDAAYYFIKGLKMYGPSFDRCMPGEEIELTESEFYFKRENPWGGFSNKHINFINFSEDYDLYMMGSQEN